MLQCPQMSAAVLCARVAGFWAGKDREPMGKIAVEERPDIAVQRIDTAVAAVPAVVDTDAEAGAIRRLVVRLAWPSIVENMLQSVFGIVLLLIVARLGPAAVAGFGAANGLTMVAMSAFFSLSMGATVLVAHATGAQTPAAARL